jgi:hypothetical protein
MSSKIITINETVKLMELFSSRHNMLNDFGFGNTWDIGTSRQMEFPYMWATIQPSNIELNNNKSQIPAMNYTIIFADKINDNENPNDINGEGSNNGQEIISDTFQYAQDFVQYVLTTWGQFGLMILDSPTITPIFDDTTDKVNGWALDVTFRLKHYNCVLPI